MQGRHWALSALCLALLWPGQAAISATINHDNVEDFLPGHSDGIAVPMIDKFIAATGPKNGGVGIMPKAGAGIFSDEFSYASQADAEAAGWLFLLPNAQPTDPSSFSFTDTPGSLRMHVSRPQDFHNTADPNQQSPVLAVKNQPISGDFIAETKITIAEPRQRERSQGLIILNYADPFNPVAIDSSTRYVDAGPNRVDQLMTSARLYDAGDNVAEADSWIHTSQTYYIRIVKMGQYFYTFFKDAETSPWIFQQYIKNPDLAAGQMVVGVFAKSWGGPNAADEFQNDDFDYVHVTQLDPKRTGTFSNVFDAGAPADWQTVSFNAIGKQTVKYQLRAGDDLQNGTLADGGSFVGPDGKTTSFYTDDRAAVVPASAAGKRYLEYQLSLDQSADNIPANLLNISATFEPAGAPAKLVSSLSDFGTGGTGISVQPGDGDLSLTRTPVVTDDFNATTLGAEYTFDAGNPGAEGDYSLTERTGYLRLKTGYQQDFYVGDNEIGGVKVFRNLPSGLTNYEVETEVNMENQQDRAAGIMLWQDPNNFVGITLSRRFFDNYEIGAIADPVLNDGGAPAYWSFYGSNTLQLRVAKVGNIITLSYRDAETATPSWHVMATYDTTKAATGGLDFNPTQVALFGKSYLQADRSTINSDFNYLKISSLAATGTKDIALTLPAGSKADSVLIMGDAAGPQAARFQVNGVGPDGTAATWFTVNEPKIPASLAGQTNLTLNVSLDATSAAGVPYVHTAGILYADANTHIAQDTNAADFAAGAVKTGVDLTTTPGLMTPVLSFGTPAIDEFNYSDNDLASKGYVWENPSGLSSYSFTENPGHVRLNVNRPEDLWVFPEKQRVLLHQATPVTGNWEIETHMDFPNGRQDNRTQGIGIWQDADNFIMFGTDRLDALIALSFRSNIVEGPRWAPGYTANSYDLRIRKVGPTFTCWYRLASTDDWTLLGSFDNANIVNPTIGFLAKAWGGPSPEIQPIDFDYLKITPVIVSGTFESRTLDLGVTGLYPYVDSLGGNAAGLQLQFRAADTPEGLASATYVGPDGTNATYYSGAYSGLLHQSLFGKRYFQYRALLPTGTVLNDLSIIGLATAPNLPIGHDDIIAALRIAGGLDAANASQLARLDIAKNGSAGHIDVADAIAIARQALGQ